MNKRLVFIYFIYSGYTQKHYRDENPIKLNFKATGTQNNKISSNTFLFYF